MHIPVKEFDSLLFEQTSEFTLFVVEARFFNGLGRDFFLSYKDSKGYFDSENKVRFFLKNNIFKYIYKNISPIGEIISSLFDNKKLAIGETVGLLSKLFSSHQQYASSPEFIDPIILFEQSIDKATIGELVSLYYGGHLKPKVILVLQDNDIDRVKGLLGNCPHKTKVCFIKNDGSKEDLYVHNVGADNLPEFVNLYSRQCFNSCGKTDTGILYNEEWANNSYIRLLSPSLLKTRSQLMMGEKLKAIEGLNNSINRIEQNLLCANSTIDKDLLLSFEGMGKLFRVFCNDFGGNDIDRVLQINNHLNNDIFKAHIYRYAHFIPEASRDRSKASEYLSKAEEIFFRNNMEDHAIYCRNNILVHSFYTDEVSVSLFDKVTQAARNNVPGLVGMPILFNNAGVANLYNARFEEAIEQFDLAMEYDPQHDHRLGIMCNRLIAYYLASQEINESDIMQALLHAKSNLVNEKQHFLAINNIANLAVICSKDKNIDLDIFHDDYFRNLLATLSNSSNDNLSKYTIRAIENRLSINLLPESTSVRRVENSRRKQFISLHTLNPEIYNAWL